MHDDEMAGVILMSTSTIIIIIVIKSLCVHVHFQIALCSRLKYAVDASASECAKKLSGAKDVGVAA
jgi:hypothetical protein